MSSIGHSEVYAPDLKTKKKSSRGSSPTNNKNNKSSNSSSSSATTTTNKSKLYKSNTMNLRLEDPTQAAQEAARKKEELRQYFHNTYQLFEEVFKPLSCEEAYSVPPIHKLRHPMIFYLGHTAAFYMNKLVLAGLTSRLNAKFEEMFAIGVDEMSWDDLNEEHYDFPDSASVWDYRQQVRQRVDSLFNSYSMPLPLTFENSQDSESHIFYWIMAMGVEHERIHVETASVHLRELPLKYIRTPAEGRDDFWAPCSEDTTPPQNELVAFDGDEAVAVGRPMDSPGYGWDVDYSDNLTIPVKPFKASKYVVSNAEFYEFVQAGGYTTEKYWDQEGWQWVTWKKPQHPWFWVKDHENPGKFKLRAVVEEIPMKWSWPAEVNQLEAHAFCQWKSEQTGRRLRLPTEAEWLHMRDTSLGASYPDQWSWSEAPGNVNLEHFRSSCPVNKYQQGQLFDIIGNVWQHTETPVYPYKGYQVHPLYDDFSMPTFDGRHHCIKGGSWVSTGNEATRDARYAFRRHFFQYVGIRYVEGEDVDEMAYTKNCLGMDPEVDLATEICYYPQLPQGVVDAQRPQQAVYNYAMEVYKQFGQHLPKPDCSRSLNLLCGAGLGTFLLAQHFQEAIGVDFTARVLQPAFAIRERGMADYSVGSHPAEGADSLQRTAVHFDASREAPTWAATRERAFFYQSDPANLHSHLKEFSLIVMFDVLSQGTTYAPSEVPAHLLSRLLPGGLLVVVERDQHSDQRSNSRAAGVEVSEEQFTAIMARNGAHFLNCRKELTLHLPTETGASASLVRFAARAFRKMDDHQSRL